MHLCPSCKTSRWVYPKWIPFAELLEALTGCGRYECVACGWRGWRRSPATVAPLPVVHQLRRVPQFVSRLLAEHVSRGFLIPPLKRFATLRTAGTWVMLAFVLGVAVGVLFYSGAERTAGPNTLPAAEQAPASLEAAAQTAGSPSEARPPSSPAVAGPRVDTPLVASPPRASANAEQTVPRANAVRPTTAQRENVAPAAHPGQRVVGRRSQPGQLDVAPSGSEKRPRYRGSLAIESDPPGARVSVDGRVVGATPIVLKDVAAGSRVVRVESHGYELWSTAARVVADQQTRVIATLQRGSLEERESSERPEAAVNFQFPTANFQGSRVWELGGLTPAPQTTDTNRTPPAPATPGPLPVPQ
jgi:hypothetical protein